MNTKLFLTALSILLLSWPKTAAAQCSRYGGRATVVQVNAAGIVPVVLGDTGYINSTGGINDASLLGASVPALLAGEALSATAAGAGRSTRAQASLSNLKLTVAGNTIGAAFVTAEATAYCGSGSTGSAKIDGLVVNGQSVVVTGTPNQTVSLLGGGYIILNEQTTNSGSITVNAIHLRVPAVADAIIDSASAAISRPVIAASGGPAFIVTLLLQAIGGLDITMTKSGPSTVVTSSALTYAIGLGNGGSAAVTAGTSATVLDQLPSGVTATDAGPGTGVDSVSCTNLNSPGAMLTCTVMLSSDLAPGVKPGDANAATFTIAATAPSSAGSITNYASVDSTGGTSPPDPTSCSGSNHCSSASTTVNTPVVTNVPANCTDFTTGGGWIIAPDNRSRANFSVAGGVDPGGNPIGHLEYVDHSTARGLNVHGIGQPQCTIPDVGSICPDPTTSPNFRQLSGNAQVTYPNGTQSDVPYTVCVADNGEPGGHDMFSITLDTIGYMSGLQTVHGGNIQLHQ
jgi:hypothetical protein